MSYREPPTHFWVARIHIDIKTAATFVISPDHPRQLIRPIWNAINLQAQRISDRKCLDRYFVLVLAYECESVVQV